jgi:carbonic anhydrase
MNNNSFPRDAFSEELLANDEYIKSFKYSGLTGVAQKGLAIVTCMDSRINPLSIMGMKSGEDVLRTLVLATYLLGVKKILVMPHTNCRMASAEEADIHEHIEKEFGVNTRSLEFRTVKDQEKALALDVSRIRAFPFLNKDVVVGGAIYDVTTGKITPVDC